MKVVRLQTMKMFPYLLTVMLICSLHVIAVFCFRYVVILIVIHRMTLKLLELLPCRDTRVLLIHLRCP